MKNKKAAIDWILFTLVVVLGLSFFALFEFAKNKKNIDAATLDTQGLDKLYSQEAVLQTQLNELSEKSVGQTKQTLTDQTDESAKEKFKQEYLTHLKENIVPLQNENTNLAQIKEKLEKKEFDLEMDNQQLKLEIKQITFTILNQDKTGKELFRAVYTHDMDITTSIN